MDDFIEKKLLSIELIIKEIKTYAKAKDKVLHTPFLLVDNSVKECDTCQVKFLNSENKS